MLPLLLLVLTVLLIIPAMLFAGLGIPFLFLMLFAAVVTAIRPPG